MTDGKEKFPAQKEVFVVNIKRIIQAAHTKLKVHRWIAWLLCAAMIGGMVSSALPALAVNENDIENTIDDIDSMEDIDHTGDVDNTDDADSEDTYCEHHPEHTEECGYVEAVEGQPCTHVHDGECGYVKPVEAVEAVEGQPCTH